jgi:ATPase subunit of ABC transporter with duplicated ATPase domains
LLLLWLLLLLLSLFSLAVRCKVDYVTFVAREHDPLLSDDEARRVMGSLGLSGEKATRPIGTLSGGEKARVALATFCLTPHNVLLLDEPVSYRLFGVFV